MHLVKYWPCVSCCVITLFCYMLRWNRFHNNSLICIRLPVAVTKTWIVFHGSVFIVVLHYIYISPVILHDRIVGFYRSRGMGGWSVHIYFMVLFYNFCKIWFPWSWSTYFCRLLNKLERIQMSITIFYVVSFDIFDYYYPDSNKCLSWC